MDLTKDNISLSFTVDNSTGVLRLVNGTACDHCFLLNTVKNDSSQQVCDLLKCVTFSLSRVYCAELAR